jgi:hypothetical protein
LSEKLSHLFSRAYLLANVVEIHHIPRTDTRRMAKPLDVVADG